MSALRRSAMFLLQLQNPCLPPSPPPALSHSQGSLATLHEGRLRASSTSSHTREYVELVDGAGEPVLGPDGRPVYLPQRTDGRTALRAVNGLADVVSGDGVAVGKVFRLHWNDGEKARALVAACPGGSETADVDLTDYTMDVLRSDDGLLLLDAAGRPQFRLFAKAPVAPGMRQVLREVL